MKKLGALSTLLFAVAGSLMARPDQPDVQAPRLIFPAK
jgi:hypothetical protein